MQGQKRLHFPIERDLSPRDITAYKKGLMLARQAAQPSCQLRWCGGGALGKQAVTCQPDCSGARVRCGAARPFVADCRFAPAAKPFQPVRPLRLVRWSSLPRSKRKDAVQFGGVDLIIAS